MITLDITFKDMVTLYRKLAMLQACFLKVLTVIHMLFYLLYLSFKELTQEFVY